MEYPGSGKKKTSKQEKQASFESHYNQTRKKKLADFVQLMVRPRGDFYLYKESGLL